MSDCKQFKTASLGSTPHDCQLLLVLNKTIHHESVLDVPVNPIGQLHSPGRTHCPPFRQAGLHIAGGREEGRKRERGRGREEEGEREERGRGKGVRGGKRRKRERGRRREGSGWGGGKTEREEKREVEKREKEKRRGRWRGRRRERGEGSGGEFDSMQNKL